MLRITHATEGPHTTLKLEGRIVSNWVLLLREECLRILKNRKRVWLDFSGVTFVDKQGVEMLRVIAGKEIKLINCSPLIENLLQDEEGGNQ